MAQQSRSNNRSRTAQTRETYTLERAAALAPTARVAAALTQAYGL